jgi:hypothetical protein
MAAPNRFILSVMAFMREAVSEGNCLLLRLSNTFLAGV